MNDKVYRLILQIAFLCCLAYLATLGMFEAGSITMIIGTIVGYVFGTKIESYKKKD